MAQDTHAHTSIHKQSITHTYTCTKAGACLLWCPLAWVTGRLREVSSYTSLEVWQNASKVWGYHTLGPSSTKGQIQRRRGDLCTVASSLVMQKWWITKPIWADRRGAEPLKDNDVCEIFSILLPYHFPKGQSGMNSCFSRLLPTNTAQWWLGKACQMLGGKYVLLWVWVCQSRCQSDWQVIVSADSRLRATALPLRRNITHWPLQPQPSPVHWDGGYQGPYIHLGHWQTLLTAECHAGKSCCTCSCWINANMLIARRVIHFWG